MTRDDLSRLFEAERAVQPPPRALEHGLSRLLTDVAQQVAPLPVATGSLKLGLSVASKWLIGGFLLGLTGAGAASQIWPREAAVRHAVTSVGQAVRDRPASPAPAVTPALPVEAPREPEPMPAVAARSDRSVPSAVPVPSDSAATFDAELRLITAAKSEFDQGRPELAAAWLSEHAERFPTGAFALDREAMRVLVRCSQGKDPILARTFARQHPSSPMLGRLLRACTPLEPAVSPSAVDFPKIDK